MDIQRHCLSLTQSLLLHTIIMLFSRKSRRNRNSKTTASTPSRSSRQESFQKQTSIASTISDVSTSTSSSSSGCYNSNVSIRSLHSTISKSTAASTTSPITQVRFSKALTVRQTLHHKDYTPEEIAACWYDGFESEEMVNEAKFVASLYQNPDLLVDDNKYPKRGLESILNKDNTDAKQSIKAVLFFQEEHSKKGSSSKQLKSSPDGSPSSPKNRKRAVVSPSSSSSSSKRIESVYTVYTQGSKFQARLVGLSDELAVQEQQQQQQEQKPQR